MIREIPATIERMYVEVGPPYFTKDHLVECIKEWNPVGEPVIKIGAVSYSKNHSEGVLQYYKPFHIYVVIKDKPQNGDFVPVFDIHGKMTSYHKVENDGNFLEYRIIGTTDYDLHNQRCFDINKSFLENYSKYHSISEKFHLKSLSDGIELVMYENKLSIYYSLKTSDNKELVDYKALRRFLERNIIPDGNPALILDKLDNWYKENYSK